MSSCVILFDRPDTRQRLLPLTYTRPIGALRVGIHTIIEKWSRDLNISAGYCTESYLENKFPDAHGESYLYISGGICPGPALLHQLAALDTEVKLIRNNQLIAFRTSQKVSYGQITDFSNSLNHVELDPEVPIREIVHPWDIFRLNADEIQADFEKISSSRTSQVIDDQGTTIYRSDNIFVEEGAIVKAAVLNAENGPIYLGKNAEIQEGALIRGPFALCEGAVVNMGAKVRGDSTVGPYSKIGGEVSNSVILGYSNKGHDGFLGNSVIGEWCNLGADTNTSNLKNNYAEVRVWNYNTEGFAKTGLQFCGLIMGDHSKCGINTMFNTGTVVGVNSNIFGSGFPRNFVPSYSWGGAAGFTTYKTKTALEVAKVVMQRRKVELTDADSNILSQVFEQSSKYRVWEKEGAGI